MDGQPRKGLFWYTYLVKRTLLWALAIGLAILLPPRIASLFPRMGVYVIVPAIVPPEVAQAAPAPLPMLSPADQIFADNPLLERACSCESWGDPNKVPRQYDDDGVTPLWGRIKAPSGRTVILKRDVGTCQINTIVHAAEIKASGLDVIHDRDANVEFAAQLYAKSGMQPWAASASCWDK